MVVILQSEWESQAGAHMAASTVGGKHVCRRKREKGETPSLCLGGISMQRWLLFLLGNSNYKKAHRPDSICF